MEYEYILIKKEVSLPHPAVHLRHVDTVGIKSILVTLWGEDWIHLAQNLVQRRAVDNTVVHPQVR
jgi:hypothetical protein